MTIQLTAPILRQIFPKAPQEVIDAFVAKQDVLDRVGVTHTRTRLSYFFANIEHECGGFTIKNLTENTNYTAERAAAVWPKRFPPVVNGKGDPAAVRRKYGTATGWQYRMFDDIYGNRMGNRPGTNDGSTFIGRGGPQWTGRDGYAQLARFLGQDAVALPSLAARYDLQPEVCAGFWDWKKLNAKADTGDFKGAVRLWNGGQIGLADREAAMAGNDPFIARLQNVDRIMPQAKVLPGSPPTPVPPKQAIDDATKTERKARAAGAAGAVGGGANEVAKTADAPVTTAGTQQPTKSPLLPTPAAYGLIAAGIVLAIVATVLIARKTKAVAANWF
jgi:putative chitinase